MNSLNLWQHQKEATEFVKDYLTDYQDGLTDGAALVRMPTGTGKTGVIAALSCLCAEHKSLLVLSPSTAIRDQLQAEIGGGFWAKTGSVPSELPQVFTFTPTTLSDVLDVTENLDRSVAVSTIQSLMTVKKDEDLFERLAQWVRLVIFDEGHREPAQTWGRAVRDLSLPTILFTATPYRNDFSFFNVSAGHLYRLSHPAALKGTFVRPVEFAEVGFSDAATFVQELLAYTTDLDKKTGVANARVVVRCATAEAIKDVVQELLAANEKAVGIHDTFKTGGSFYQNVPDFRNVVAKFWVHQRKLLEGLDDPNFSALGVFDDFVNARDLVQQVGRIIRNPSLKKKAKALVFSGSGSRVAGFWSRYLKYEEQTDWSIFGNDYTVGSSAQANLVYVDGDFRRQLRLSQPNAHLVFRYRKTVNVFRLVGASSLQKLASDLMFEWEKYDRIVYTAIYPDSKTIVIPYISEANSPVLLEEYFVEPKIGFTFLHLQDGLLFYRDTGGRMPANFKDETKKIEPLELRRLFKKGGSRASSVSLINSDVGRRSVRRRSIHAHSVQETAPRLADHSYFCSTVNGYVTYDDGTLVGRYVGFTRGRVSDRHSEEEDYQSYISWLQKIIGEIKDDKRTANDVLMRYAKPVDAPTNTNPQHVLLDIRDVIEDQIYLRRDDGAPLEIDDLCMDVQNGVFQVQANSENFDVSISYDDTRQRYRLACPKIDAKYVAKSSGDQFRRSLMAHINFTQAFRVVPDDVWTIYAHSKFYSPRRLKQNSEFRNLFEPTSELDNIGSEKGTEEQFENAQGPLVTWPDDSIFKYLDHASSGLCNGIINDFLKDREIMVCDDLGFEIADFVAACPSTQSVAFIHCKTGKKRSASDFQEVCGQALKNLEALSPFGEFRPHNLKRWDSDWVSKWGTVEKRIRKGGLTGRQLWSEISQIVANPNANREVWIVYSGFDWTHFENELKKPKPRAEVVQLVYLLRSTWGEIASIGARLRIFCPVTPV